MECIPTAFAGLPHHPALRALAEEAEGRPVHAVGGVLRDLVLDPSSTPHDLDAVVAGEGAEVAARLARRLGATLVLLGGDRFAATRLVHPQWCLDLWDRESASLEFDLARRDLTINALALDLHRGELVDPFGGLGDLAARCLRAVTPASFRDDPLRVLRLARFAAVLEGFSVEPATLALAREAAPGVAAIAHERIREELARLFAARGTLAGLRLLAGTGLLVSLLGAEVGTSELPASLERPLARLEQDPELARRPHAALLRWVLVCRTIPGPGRLREETPDHLLERGLISREEARGMGALLRLGPIPEDGLEQRRYLHRAGKHAEAALDLCQLAGDVRQSALRQLFHEHGEEILHPPRLVDGLEAAELLGLRPGPELGRALGDLKQAQVDGEVSTREQALAFLRGRSTAAPRLVEP